MMQRPFNIYAVGKELYNIPDDRLREFLTDFPQAVKLSPEQVKTGIQPRVPSAGAVTGKPGKYAQGSEPDAENRLSQQDVQKIQEKRNRTALLRNEPLGLSGEVHIFDRILGRPFNRPYTSDGISGPKLDKISRQVPAGSAAMEQAIRNNYKRAEKESHSPEQQALRELDRINEDIDKAMTSPEIRRGMSGNAITRLGGRYSSMLNMYGNDTDMQAENDYNNLKTARTKINEARNTIRAAQGKRGFWKGLSDELFSEKALSLGLNEIEDGGRLQVLLDKAEKEGLDALTPSEKTLLDAVSIKSVTDMLHADNIPFWYHVGSGVGASIPYMMQFAVTKIPASAATKPLTRYITRRFLTGAAQKAAGRGVRHAAANFGRRALAGTANTALIGTAMAPLQPTTYSDMLQRHMGQTHATLDENGKVKYLGQENRKSVGRSIAEGLGASTISNVAEMSGALLGTVGKFLKPGTRKVISATTRHISPRLTGFISRTTPRALDYTKMIKDKNIITGFRDFAKATGWNGIAGETFEEFMEGTLNAVTIGDQGLEDIYNWENALQTITTVGVMSVGMSSAAATLRAGAKRKIKADYDRADRHLNEAFSPSQVAEIKSILGENLQDQSKILGQMFAESSKATTPEERKQRSQEQAIIQDYIYKANLYEAYLGGLQSRIKEESGRIIENLRRQANPDMGATIYADYRGQTVRITSGTFDIDPEGNITPREGSTGMLTIITPEGDTQVVSPSQLGKVQDYMTLDEQASTVEQQVEDAVLSQEESEMNTLAPGTVVSVNKNGSPLRVIVTSQNADTIIGRIVDPYGKPVTGPDGQEQTLTFTLDEIQSYPEEESGAGVPEIEQPVEERISDATVQDNYVYKGNEAEKVLLDIFDKGTDEVLPRRIETVSEFEREFSSPVRTVLGEVVKVGRNLYNKLVRNSRENISGAIRPTLEAADFVINDTDGSRLYVKMYKKSDGKKTYNVTVVNKQGEVEDYISSAHIKSENNLLNKIRNGAELSLPSERNPYGRNLPNSPAPIPFDKDRGIIENRQAIEERISADSHIEPGNIPALQRIPKDAQGNPLYEQADPDTAWDAIVEQTGGDEQVAQNVAASMLADKEAALKRLQKSQPKGGTTIAEKIAAEKERQAAIDQAKQQVDIWKKIAQTPQKRKQQAETERIRQAEEEKIKSDGAGRTESDSEQDGNGTQETFSQGTSAEDIRQVQRGRGLGNGLNEEDSTAFMSLMEANAVQPPQIELNPTNWVEQFGEDGKVTTPIGIVKMGNNQIEKLFEKGRSQQFGMIKPTLEQPLAVIEVPSTTDNGTEERESSYLFVKTFLGKNGEKVYYFKSVTVKKDGLEVSVSSHYDRPARIKDALKKGKLLYRFDGGAQTEQRPADVSVTASPKRLQGILEDKNTKKSLNGKESDEKVAPVEAEIKPIGRGVFGNIYDQFKGKAKAAIDFLSRLHDGEAIGALHHKDVGDISLVWGNEKAGLQKIIKKHPEVLGNIQDIIDGMHIVQTSENRIKLESDSHFAVISRDWKGEAHTPWLLTAYEKKENSAINNTMDTVDTSKGEQNDTATPQGTVSDDKSTKNPLKANELGEKIAAVEAKTDTNRASGRGGSRDSRGSGEISATAAIEGSGKKELTKEEAAAFIAFMEEHAEVAPEMELTIENWDAEFGENGIVQTPVGKVKMGENQFTKLMRQGRSGKLGMIKPTLENPDVIIEDESKAKEGDITERDSSYVFVKTFKKSDGSRYYYFTSVTVSQGNMEVVVSNQEKTKKRISNLLQRNAISWISEKVQSASEAQNGKSVSLDDSWTATQADNNTAPLGINSSELSENKGSKKTPITSESGEKVAVAERERKAAIEQAKQQVDIWKQIAETPRRRKEAEATRQEETNEQAAENREQTVPSDVERGRQRNLGQAEEVRLSEEVDENGRQFVLSSDGKLEFGKIDAETGLTSAPILLSEGLITNTATNDGYGLVHIEARHGDQIRKAGYKSVLVFIEDVAKNYESIKEGKDRNGNQTYMLQLKDKHNNTLMVELSSDGNYWNINTAGIFKESYGRNRKEVYNRHTTAKQSAESAEASQEAEQSGTPTSSSMINAPTSSSNINGHKLSSSDVRLTEPQKEGLDLVPTPNSVSSSENKGTNFSQKGKELGEKVAAAEKERQAAIEQAKRQVDIWKKIAGTAQKRKQQVETELIRQAEKEKMKADDTGRTESDSEQGRNNRNGEESQEAALQEKLSKNDAADIIVKMEMSAIPDPQISLSPESWQKSFGLDNSIDTPMGKVKMGEGQYQKLIDKKRSAEFGMVVQTLQDPDIVFIEPSEAKDEQITERNFSYVFVKTFIRDGKKLKYYTSVSVLKDGMEVSVSSHIANKSAILKKLQGMDRAYTKESLLPNSSEWHLAEHLTDVPDLLPTQRKSETSESKSTKKSFNGNELEGKKTDFLIGKTIVHKDGKQKIKFTAQEEGRYIGDFNGEKGSFIPDLVERMIETGEWTEEDGTPLPIGQKIKAVETETDTTPNETQAGNGQAPFLSESEYIDRALQEAFDGSGITSREEWEDSEAYIDAYNRASDSYPDYILGLQSSGRLQEMYDRASIGERISIREGIETAGYKVKDILDTEKEKQEARKKRDTARRKRSEELMAKLGIVPDKANEADSLLGENGEPADGELDGRKETSAPSNSRMDVISSHEDKSDDTATRQEPDISENNDTQKQGKKQPNETNAGQKAKKSEVSDSDTLSDFAKETFHEIEEQLSGSLKGRVTVRTSSTGNEINENFVMDLNVDGKPSGVYYVEFLDTPITGNVGWFALDDFSVDTPEKWDIYEQSFDNFLKEHPDVKKHGAVLFSESGGAFRRMEDALSFREYAQARFSSENSDEKNDNPKKKLESQKTKKIEDVGEKIGGARKDKIHEYIEKEKRASESKDDVLADLAQLPLSKIYNFDYETLRKEGVSNEAITLLQVIKSTIPSKPRKDYKLRRWVSDVFSLYHLALKIITSDTSTQQDIMRKALNIPAVEKRYHARMALGGYDSGIELGNATLEELQETAGHYDKEGNWISAKGQWYVTGADRYGGIYKTLDEAKEALRNFAGFSEGNKGDKKVQFSIYSYRKDGTSFITIKGKPSVVIESGFKDATDARKYLEEHYDDLVAKWGGMKETANIGFTEGQARQGKNWRAGRDISAEEFRNTFGFRGVEFGNWANQAERQTVLNNSYDALMDLAEVIGKSPKALSLNGELGIAFGSRGSGKASAHYEQSKVVINLTKTQGTGSLAHEWWHALDNYFARKRGQRNGFNSDRTGYKYNDDKKKLYSEEERQELTDSFKELMKAINNSGYGQRSKSYASMKSSYWNRPTELGARAFETWVNRKMSENGVINYFLATPPLQWGDFEFANKYYPYPMESDFESLDTAFDNLFNTIQEKVDEDTGNSVLFNIGREESVGVMTEQQRVVFESVMEMLERASIPVEVLTNEQMNALSGNGEVRLMGSRVDKRMAEIGKHFEGKELDDNTRAVVDVFSGKTDNKVIEVGRPEGTQHVVMRQGTENKAGTKHSLFRHFGTRNNHITPEDIVRIPEVIAKGERIVDGKKVSYSYTTEDGTLLRVTTEIRNRRETFTNFMSNRKSPTSELVEHATSAQASDERESDVKVGKKSELTNGIGEKPCLMTISHGRGGGVEFDEFDHAHMGDGKEIIYGATAGGKIYLNGSALNPETPIHEYTHLWDTACQNINPELWLRGVELMKQTPLWEQVQADPAYADLTTDDEIAGEVHSRLTGKDGARLLEDIVSRSRFGNAIEVAKAVTLRERLKKWLKDFWWWLKDTLSPWTKAEAERVTIEDFVHMPLKDLVRGTDLTGSRMTAEESRIVERAKADGTYMKAPNGKPTNLSERQWVQVRTKAFKERFGDWEKAAKVLNVVPAAKDHGFKNFAEAKEWAKANIVRTFTNEETYVR